jgi:serine/threonine protein kinase
LTGQVVGLGTYGNVLEGVLGGCLPAAIKLFDFQIKGAREAFVTEQKGYKYLKPLQGKCVPILYAVGCMAHCNMVFMAFSDEGISKLGTSLLTRSLKKQVLEALDDIHNHGILHNDVKLEHVLISQGAPKFIDFQGSSNSASDEDFTDIQNLCECCWKMRVKLEMWYLTSSLSKH